MASEETKGPATSRYLRAAEAIPRGETRSFTELAAAAGRPGAARAAGRAIGAVPSESRSAWHRVVASDGSLARDPGRAALQLRRLRGEGARPRAGESVRAWAGRLGIPLLVSLATRRFVAAGDPRAARMDPSRVEAAWSESAALARRFLHADAAEPPCASLPSVERRPPGSRAPPPSRRIGALDWGALAATLANDGVARVPGILRARECDALLAEASDAARFDRSVDMEPRGYGVGRYFYWKEPAPDLLFELRRELYAYLAPVARAFVRPEREFPPTLDAFWRRCRAAGQRRPSSIFLSYAAGGVNHPHRDLYGKLWFPLQALVVLSRRGRDFDGGEFVLWREEARGELVPREIAADRGELVLFASSRLPSTRSGGSRPVLHGMRALTRGRRHALGIAFHLAR